jgi:hypothetical protein
MVLAYVSLNKKKYAIVTTPACSKMSAEVVRHTFVGNTHRYRDNPKHPSPTLCLGKKASSDGSYDWAYQRTHRPYSQGSPSLFLNNRPAIVPPPIVIGVDPATPWRKRNPMSMFRLLLTAQATVKTMKRTFPI